MSNMERVLRLMAEKGASDVYLSANTPILIKINGQVLHLSDQALTPSQPRQLLAEVLTPQQLEELDGRWRPCSDAYPSTFLRWTA
jgi:twitching motility protein PilU